MKKVLYLFMAAAVWLVPQAASHASGKPQGAAPSSIAVIPASAIPPTGRRESAREPSRANVALPPPTLKGSHALPQLLTQRRSVRSFAATPLTLAQLGQLLWAAQGVTGKGRLRTTPSAGALCPLELYVVVGNVRGLAAGIYRYHVPTRHLLLVARGDRRAALASAANRQTWLAAAPITIVFAAEPARTAAKYVKRADRVVQIETGHAAENLWLQAQDLGLGTVDVGAFDDGEVARLLQLPDGIIPVLLMPVGTSR